MWRRTRGVRQRVTVSLGPGPLQFARAWTLERRVTGQSFAHISELPILLPIPPPFQTPHLSLRDCDSPSARSSLELYLKPSTLVCLTRCHQRSIYYVPILTASEPSNTLLKHRHHAEDSVNLQHSQKQRRQEGQDLKGGQTHQDCQNAKDYGLSGEEDWHQGYVYY